jgi:hypothetical protein
MTGTLRITNQDVQATPYVTGNAPTNLVRATLHAASVQIDDVTLSGLPDMPPFNPEDPYINVFRVQVGIADITVTEDHEYIEFKAGDSTPWEVVRTFTITMTPDNDDDSNLERRHGTEPRGSKLAITHPHECHLDDRWNAEITMTVTTNSGLSVTRNTAFGGGRLTLAGEGTGPSFSFEQHKCDATSGSYPVKQAGIENVAYEGAAAELVTQTITTSNGMEVRLGGDDMEWWAPSNLGVINDTWAGGAGPPYVFNGIEVKAYDWDGDLLVERTDVRLTGFYDEDNDPITPTLATIHAWGARSYLNYTFESRVRPWPQPLQFDTDTTWARAQNLEVGTGAWTDQQWIIDGAHLGAAPAGSPYFAMLDLYHVESIDVVDPPGAPSRPALWTGSGGLVVDGGNNDLWHVPSTATAPLARIDLVNQLDARWARVVWPTEYLKWKANQSDRPDTGSYENPYFWHNWRYARIKFASAPRAATLTVTFYYYEVEVSDNHTSPGRFVTVTRGDLRSFSESISVPAGSSVWRLVDFIRSRRRLMREVVRVEIGGFPVPESGTDDWTFTDVELALDPGDPATGRAAVAQNVRGKSKQSWDLTELGWSMRTDGHACGWTPDDFLIHSERGIQYVNWVFTPGGDASAAWTVAQLATILDDQEGLEAAKRSASFDAALKDVDGNYLHADGYSFWTRQDVNHDLDPGGGRQWEGSVRVRSWDPVGHTEYRPRAVKILGGLGHGIARASNSPDRGAGGQSPNNSRNIDVYRRPPSGPWAIHSSADPDAHARYVTKSMRVMYDSPSQTRWEYGATRNETPTGIRLFDLVNAYRREFVYLDLPTTVGNELDHLRDSERRLQVYYINVDGQMVRRLYSGDDQAYAETILWPAEVEDRFPSIMQTTGQLTLVWKRGEDVYAATSHSNGRAWTVPTLVIADRDAPEAEMLRSRGMVCLAVHDGADYRRRILTWNAATEAWVDSGTEVTIAAGAQASRGSLKVEGDGSLTFFYVDSNGDVQYVQGRLDVANTLGWS